MSAPPTVGSTRPPVHRAAASATRIASARPRLELVDRARLAVHPGEFGIVAEPAGLLVEPLKFGIDGGQRQVQFLWRPGRDPCGRAQRRPFGDGHAVRVDASPDRADANPGWASVNPSRAVRLRAGSVRTENVIKNPLLRASRPW